MQITHKQVNCVFTIRARMAQISANVKAISLPAMCVDICKVQAVAETETKIGYGVQSPHVQSSHLQNSHVHSSLLQHTHE